MLEVGENLYGMRIVKTYHGLGYEETPHFNGFEGVVVWSTWDTGDWQVLQCWMENGEYRTKEIGVLEYDGLNSDKTGEEIANLIKEQIKQIYTVINREEHKVTNEQVRQALLDSETVAPRNEPAIQNISKKGFNALVKWTTKYVNEHISLDIHPSIAIDETIAMVIQTRD